MNDVMREKLNDLLLEFFQENDERKFDYDLTQVLTDRAVDAVDVVYETVVDTSNFLTIPQHNGEE